MKRFSIILMCLSALLLSVSACSSKHSKNDSTATTESSESTDDLKGKWRQTLDENGVTGEIVYSFDGEGHMTQSAIMNISAGQNIYIEVDGESDYTYKDDVITFKFTPDDITFKKFEIEGLPGDYVDMAMEEMKKNMSATEDRITNVKIDGNTLTATNKGQTVTLTRIR